MGCFRKFLSIGEEMKEQFVRTGMLIGNENLDKLSKCRVAVFGIGGVGG